MRTIFILFCLGFYHFGSALQENERCATPDGRQGNCVLANFCPLIVNLLLRANSGRPLTIDEANFINSSKCGIANRKNLVCCASTTTNSRVSSDLLPQPGVCGVDLSDRIYGGEKTKLEQYPWLALVQYRKQPKNDFGFHCGGSLINENYVVTAAHCVSGIPKSVQVWAVRLGEWDLDNALDCDEEGVICNNAVDVRVEKVIIHKDYDPDNQAQYNDISLLRLKERVRYQSGITPICLPSANRFKTLSLTGHKMWVAGWGATETTRQSRYKLHVGINGFDQGSCRNVFAPGNIGIIDSQICAGGEKGKDSCQGDSGGSLMLQDREYFYLVGIVSFGATKCGSENVPGIYTRVSSFVDWIEKNVKP